MNSNVKTAGIVLLLASISAICVAKQTTRFTHLIDYSYQVENAYRIFRGDMPYRDFFLVLPPGTYMIMAWIMKITRGYSHIGQVFLTMGVQFLTLFFTYKIIKKIVPNSLVLFFLLTPLLFGGHVLFPWPNYDIFTSLFILFSLQMLMYTVHHTKYQKSFLVLSGFCATIPMYFKQNIGFVYLAVLTAILLGYYIMKKSKKDLLKGVLFVSGAAVSIVLFILWLAMNHALQPFIYQLFIFPQTARNIPESLQIIQNEYILGFQNTLSIMPFIFFSVLLLCVSRYSTAINILKNHATIIDKAVTAIIFYGVIVALCYYYWTTDKGVAFNTTVLMSWFVAYGCYVLLMIIGTVFFILKKSRIRLTDLLALSLIGAANAAYLSHQVIGSSYGIWPFFIIISAIDLSLFTKLFPRVKFDLFAVPLLCAVTMQLFLFAKQNSFYGSLYIDSTVYSSVTPRLMGLASPGPWIPEMDQMFAYVKKNIPQDAIVAFVPGDDPFFAATGRKNPMPFNQFHVSTYNADFPTVISEFTKRNVEWIVVKQLWQSGQYYGYIDIASGYFQLENEYNRVTEIGNHYILFRKK